MKPVLQGEFGPPDDHTEFHRPKTFSEIKGTIIDKSGTFRYVELEIMSNATGERK